MLLAAGVMTLRLRPDPLLLARSHREAEAVELHPAVDDVPDVTGLAPASEAAAVRAWSVIRSSPRILAATAGMALRRPRWCR